MPDDKKAIVQEFLAAMAADELDTALCVVAEDVSWFSHGLMPQGLSGQRQGKEAAAKYMEKLSRAFFNRKRDIAIQHLYRDGDVVICEARMRGQLKNGKLYENDYGMVFDFLNGQIQAVREYFNSTIAAEAFAGLLW
ncbi:MAG TPA: nuclear transport factor 2 family protein [Candidatus Binataceae bacterium]|jgi:ketosteroid isomerase-like protein|nr:nuclear transport factor 2 family protein [Candidatus Binataceae bacterium]